MVKIAKPARIWQARPCEPSSSSRIPEPLLELNISMIRAQADSMFGEILDECRKDGRAFAPTANMAFRKRDSGERLDRLERRILRLFDRIEALELLGEIGTM